MSYPKGTNTANFNRCADWNSQDGNITAVGRNGGPSAYGTYDQAGNVDEWVDDFYSLGGSYLSSGNLLSLNTPLVKLSSSSTLDTLGFRLVGLNYTNTYILFSNPSFYTAGENVAYSFKIVNEDTSAVSLSLSSIFSRNVLSTTWTANYPSGSSGPASGSTTPSGSIMIGPSSEINFNLVSATSASSKSDISLIVRISLSDPSATPLVRESFSTVISSKFSASPSAINYTTIFNNFYSQWLPVSPNGFVVIGDANNPSDTTWGSSLGSVSYNYLMTKYEISNIEYCYFLNCVDPEGLNPQNIYDANMGSQTLGGILFTNSNASGAKYTTKPRMGNKPVNFVNWWCAARFCNWLHNGALQYSTSDATSAAPQNNGSYTLGTLTAGNIVAPNTNALFTIPTYNEWVKAAHYKGGNSSNTFWNYPTRTNTTPSSVSANIITGDGVSQIENNTANIYSAASWDPINGSQFSTRSGPTTVGTNGVSSPYGLFDMAGNVAEITVSSNTAGASLRARGGDYTSFAYYYFDLQYQYAYQPDIASSTRSASTGFRIVSRIIGDMGISISSSTSNYTQNENITISVNVTNQSNYTISGNTVSVNIFGPAFTSVGWVANYPIDSFGPESGSSANLNESIAIGPNETVSFVFTVRTTATAITPITINASITPNSLFADSNSNNNSASLTIPVQPTDLSVEISGPSTYAQSTSSTYTMVVKNLSSTYVSGVNVGLTPSGASISNFNWTADYLSASGSLSGTTSLSTQIAIFPSGQATYTINITPASTTISNLLLRATANTPSGINISDSNLANNTGILTASIIPTDISTQVISPINYTQNIPSTVQVVVSNTGQFSPSGNLSVVFSGTPQSSILWSGTYSVGSSGPTSGSGNIISSGLSLANSGTAIYNISYTAPTNTIVPISCTASATTRSPLSDSQINNNTSSASSVLSPSDLGISSSGVAYYENNGAISYSFTLTNNSPNSINGIGVNIPAPNNISNHRWSATYINASGTALGNGLINDSIYIGSSGSATYLFDATANDNFISPISCTGSVSLPNGLGIIDPISSNNQSILEIPHALLIQDVRSSKSTCDNNGSITVVVNGGVPPFRYALGSIFANSSDRTYRFNNLEPGTYNVTVIDSTAYIAAHTEEIVIEDANIEFTLNNIFPPTLLDSYAKLDFSIYGVGPFNLIFTNKETQQTIEVGAFETQYIVDIVDDEYKYVINDLVVPGSYTLTIASTNNTCSISQDIIVPNITPMSVNVSVVPDEPISINAPLITLDILDTLLIPYRHIQINSELWQLIKDFNLKDNIYLWINDERYEYRIVRTMLDKYCLNEDKIEILKLGNSSEDWYFYLYIAPSINLTSNPELLNANIELGTQDGTIKHKVIIGLAENGQIETDSPSLIKGSLIVDGIAFPDIISGLTANVSIGVNELGLGSNDFEIQGIHKTHLTNIYTAGIVTAINFLENFNVLNEYVSISQTTCNTSEENYNYLVHIKQLLLSINNVNNLSNIYLFNNNNTVHTGQLNCFATINTPMVTDTGNIDNAYTTEYFTFNTNSDHVSRFIINNQEVKNVGVISGIDSRYIIARIVDNYSNRPRSLVYENGTTIPYDEHFVKSQQIIQQVNSLILHDFEYGDILIYVPPVQSETPLPPDPNPSPPTPPTPTPTPVQTTPIVEVSKDTTNTGSLQINVFPLNTKCIIYGPQKYEHGFTGNTVFINMVPGVYKIVGDKEDLKTKNLYQNEYRIIVDKNSVSTQTVEFFSYANKLFISEKDH